MQHEERCRTSGLPGTRKIPGQALAQAPGPATPYLTGLEGLKRVAIPMSIFEREGPHYFNSLVMLDADGREVARADIVCLAAGPGLAQLGGLPLSPRAGLALLAAARGWALLEGRDHVLPDDVQAVLPAVAEHRLDAGQITGAPGELSRQLLAEVDGLR